MLFIFDTPGIDRFVCQTRQPSLQRSRIYLLVVACWLLMLGGCANTPSGEPVVDARLQKALTGAALSGFNRFGNPYNIYFNQNGGMQGVAGWGDQFSDVGRWWVDDNIVCRQWNNWQNKKMRCFRARFDKKYVYWVNRDGEVVDQNRFHPQGQRPLSWGQKGT